MDKMYIMEVYIYKNGKMDVFKYERVSQYTGLFILKELMDEFFIQRVNFIPME